MTISQGISQGTKVSWLLKDGSKGTGVTASEEHDGHVLVAMDPFADSEIHPVIYCTVTWLKVAEETPADSQP